MKKPAKIYLLFFVAIKLFRIIFLRGGRRSGKTYAIFYKLIHIAEHGTGGDILVTSGTHPNLGKIIKDFIDITGKEPTYSMKSGEYSCQYFKSKFRFRSYNTAQDAKGTKAKYLYINEADGLEEDIFNTLRLGIEKQIICDHNPTSKFWGTKLQNEKNTLVTSFRDNSFLTSEQIEDFEKIEADGKNAPVGSVEYKRYANEVLGEYSELGGQVFNKLYFIDEKEFDCKDFIKYLGIDWGDTCDPSAAVSVKFDFEKQNIFVKEEYYEVFMPDSFLSDTLKKINDSRILVYETATGGGTRILNLLQDKEFDKKFELIPVTKQTVYSSVKEMAEWSIYVCGKNAKYEFENYKISEGKFKGDDHIIDATRYVYIMVALQKMVK